VYRLCIIKATVLDEKKKSQGGSVHETIYYYTGGRKAPDWQGADNYISPSLIYNYCAVYNSPLQYKHTPGSSLPNCNLTSNCDFSFISLQNSLIWAGLSSPFRFLSTFSGAWQEMVPVARKQIRQNPFDHKIFPDEMLAGKEEFRQIW
jgi:hypothetical protein